MVNSTEKEPIPLQMAKRGRENGLKVRELNNKFMFDFRPLDSTNYRNLA
jgi:hypothetical protein